MNQNQLDEADVYVENTDIKRRLRLHIKQLTVDSETMVATVRHSIVEAEQLAAKAQQVREEAGYGGWS